MSNTLLESLRSKHEEIEHLEKALARCYGFKETHPRESVTGDLLMKKFLEEIKIRSKELLDIYNDTDGTRKEEIDVFAGNKHVNELSSKTPDVWNNFYEKVKEIKSINKKTPNNDYNDGVLHPDKLFQRALDEINHKSIFSAEENKGKCLDMHDIFLQYMNIKKLRDSNYLKIIDYLSFLSEFDKFYLIPTYIKKSKKYKSYLISIVNYLKNFFIRTQPLTDFTKISCNIDEQYEREWNEGILPGWEKTIKDLKNSDETIDFNNYCIPCKKKFTNENVFKNHLKGKAHAKEINKIHNVEEVKNSAKIELDPKEEECFKEIAYYEFQVLRFKELCGDVIENSKNHIRKKQSRNMNELEIDQEEAEKMIDQAESDEDEEKPIYNPKNVPLGWDGKPIPYWLYKLHGLGIEYKCEICGGASYWGRRAFERHFQEWRHSYGMKCLRIPNTVHFKEVTGIEDALRLYQKINDDQKKYVFKPEVEEEFEDSEGNVVSKKMYLDLKRQGLL